METCREKIPAEVANVDPAHVQLTCGKQSGHEGEHACRIVWQGTPGAWPAGDYEYEWGGKHKRPLLTRVR